MYAQPLPRGISKIFNSSTICPEKSLTCKVSALYLDPVQIHAEFTFFLWLTLYSQAFWGTVESASPPRPAHFRSLKTANASRQDRDRQTILFIDIDIIIHISVQ